MLRGPRIELTPIEAADLPQLRAWINDRETAVLSTAYRPVNARQQDAWFAKLDDRPDQVVFAIRAAEELIGTCNLTGIQPIHRSAELAIRIGDPARRGQGLGSEAVELLLQHAFADRNLHRVSLQVFADNEAALRSYRKVGFVHEGTLREAAFIGGRYVDVHTMSVLRDEWLDRRKA
jgi:diamine N-acetyltransferase